MGCVSIKSPKQTFQTTKTLSQEDSGKLLGPTPGQRPRPRALQLTDTLRGCGPRLLAPRHRAHSGPGNRSSSLSAGAADFSHLYKCHQGLAPGKCPSRPTTLQTVAGGTKHCIDLISRSWTTLGFHQRGSSSALKSTCHLLKHLQENASDQTPRAQRTRSPLLSNPHKPNTSWKKSYSAQRGRNFINHKHVPQRTQLPPPKNAWPPRHGGPTNQANTAMSRYPQPPAEHLFISTGTGWHAWS